MTASDLPFPVLCFCQNVVTVACDAKSMTVTTTRSLRPDGWYSKLLVVTCSGEAFKVKSIRKLHGIGFLWGCSFDFFPYRKIEIELVFHDTTVSLTCEEVRKQVVKGMRNWMSGWRNRTDYDEIKKAITEAESIKAIIQLMRG